MNKLPALTNRQLTPTRDYLQDVALVLGSLQRAFVPPHPHDWHYGLSVSMRGLSTQPFMVAGEEVRAGLDLVTQKVRLAGQKWPLAEYAAPEIMNNIRLWLESKGVSAELEAPELSGSTGFEPQLAHDYAAALWWLDQQFRHFKASLKTGLTSPILLYPHHFDLSLVWFPHDDKRQLSLGFSTGDDTITEPYIYLTAYPEPAGFQKISLPPQADWQTEGFSAAILPYSKLQASSQPEKLFHSFAPDIFHTTAQLWGL